MAADQVAYLALVCSAVTIGMCLLAMPLLTDKINAAKVDINRQMIDFKVKTDSSWKDMQKLRRDLNLPLKTVKKRQTYVSATEAGSYNSATSDAPSTSYDAPATQQPTSSYNGPDLPIEEDTACDCTSQLAGPNNCPAGPAGEPGDAGSDGQDGTPGYDGTSGTPGPYVIPNDPQWPCYSCPAGPPGPAGEPGYTGKDGYKGNNGVPGLVGLKGAAGEYGDQGLVGYFGPQGKVGGIGLPGPDTFTGKGLKGPKGAPGPKGGYGTLGPQGNAPYTTAPVGYAGIPGPPGRKGIPARNGRPGNRGSRGSHGRDAHYCACPDENEFIGADDWAGQSDPYSTDQGNRPSSRPDEQWFRRQNRQNN